MGRGRIVWREGEVPIDLERDCKLESSCHKAGVASRVGDAFRGLTRNAGRQKKGLSSGADC